MAVHKRSYRGYSGPLTPPWSRFSIVTRYAFKNAFQSKLITAFFVCCFFYPLGCAVALYLNKHVDVLVTALNIHALFDVDGKFFFHFLNAQGAMAFVLTALVGPGLISSDLANNALPLFLCRPFSRADYVLGKMAVLVTLLSAITWAPGLILFLIQSSLAGAAWMGANLWMAGSILLGSTIQIAILCLLALALSAWIKRKLAAGAALLGVFFFGAGLGQAVNAVLETRNGSLMNIGELLGSVEIHLFRVYAQSPVPPDLAWLALGALCVFCLLLLERKVRAYEVVKG
ncbi:MAG TPA: ABC transporter permease subunit [Terriglobia bacterium]